MVDVSKVLGSKESPLLLIPKWNHNDDLPDDQRVKIWYYQVDTEESRRYGKRYERLNISAQHDIQKKIFVDHVVAIENLSFNGTPINNGEDFYRFKMPNKLFEEIVLAITDRGESGLSDGLLGN